MASKEHFLAFRGYTKREGKRFVAICVDLDIVAQGDTAEAATKTCAELIEEYVTFVIETYPKKAHEYIPRPSPKEIMDEYNFLVGEFIASSLTDTNKKGRPKSKKGESHVTQWGFNGKSLTVCPA